MRAGVLAAACALALAAASGTEAQAPPAKPAPLHTMVFETDTLRTGPIPADLIQKMGPIHTLQGVEDLLKQNRISFTWGHGEVDSANIPIDLAMQLNNLPPKEVFVFKQGEGWVIGVVTAKH
ncbi:MAG: hypothetical protein ACXU8S_05270 [Phenylobacterium sp.]